MSLVSAGTADAQRGRGGDPPPQAQDQSVADLLANASAAPDATPEVLREFDTTVLVTLFDAVVTGAEPAPAEAVGVEWMAHDSWRGGDGLTTIPFTVTIDRAALPAGDVVVYAAAVRATAAPEPGAAPEVAWERIWFTPLTSDRFTSMLTVEPGDYEVFVAVKSQSTDAATAAGPPFGVGRYALTVPDYDSGALSTSSLVRFSNIVGLPAEPTIEELERDPYVLGTNRLVRQWETTYSRAGDIGFIFWIYGADADRGGIPDLGVEFDFDRVTADGTEPFTRLEPLTIDRDNPPPSPVADGIAIPNGAPLASFEPGDYRLVITVTDRRADETVVQELDFTVR